MVITEFMSCELIIVVVLYSLVISNSKSSFTDVSAKEWYNSYISYLEKYDIDGIRFKDGEPDFSEISKGDVEIEPFSDSRSDNFDKADIELAKQKGCSPEDVAKWRKENGYTWHECKDMKTMQKVPSEIHNNIPHSGGISEAKKGTGV